MKRKIFSILLTLVLALSFSLVMAVPSTAAAPKTLNVLPFTLEAGGGGGGAATWTTADKYNGSSSVKLVNVDGAVDYAEVYFDLPGDLTLGEIDLESTSFWCKATAGTNIPYLIFEMSGDFTGGGDLLRINNDAADSTGYSGWAKFVASSTTTDWQWEIIDTEFWTVKDTGWDTWEALEGLYGDQVVDAVLVELSGLAGPFTAYVDDITVNGVTYYGLIQDAIDSAHAFDTVEVAEGIYVESIDINRSLKLQGSGFTSPRIQGSGVTVVTISANYVEIDGFFITNPSGKHGIYAADHSNITITHNVVTDVGISDTSATGTNFGIGIVSSGAAVDDITIAVNDIGNIEGGSSKSANGIAIGWSDGTAEITNLLIEQNMIYQIYSDTGPYTEGGRGAYGILINYGCYSSGKTISPQVLNNTIQNLEGFWAHGIGLEGDTPGALVQGNSISNLIDHKTPSDAVAVQVEANDDAASVTIENNNFDNVNVGVQNVVAVALVTAENNWWGSPNGPEHAGNTFNVGLQGANVTDLVDFVPWLDAPYLGGKSFAPVALDDVEDYSSIQAAIDAATGTTITCAAGTYTENVDIDESLTLQGEDRGTTEIKFGYGAYPSEPPLIISADEVTVSGFTIRSGPYIEKALGASGGYAHTIIVTGDSALLTDLHVIKEPLLTYNDAPRIGGSAFLLTPGLEDFTLTDSTVVSEWNGIYAREDGSNIVVRNVDFTYPGQYAIMLKVITGATIEENTFTCTADGLGVIVTRGSDEIEILDNQFVGSGSLAETHIGILLQAYATGTMGEVAILRNEISKFHTGILVEDVDTSGISIHYNNITGNTCGVKYIGNPNTLDAINNWWGHTSGPHASPGLGDPISGFVLYNPWLLEPLLPGQPLPTTFDKTLCLNIGWTLVSTDNWVSANETVGDNVTLAYNYTPSDGWFEVTPAALVPVDAIYLKTEIGSGLGITYSGGVPAASSKDLEAGWNLISSATLTDAKAVLSPLRFVPVGNEQGIGLTTVVSQGDCNQHTPSFYLAALTDNDWNVLGTKYLNPFDGYWVYMNGAKNFGVVPGH